MCGICGVLKLDGSTPVTQEELRPMVRAQAHRGPDDEGLYTDNGIGLGFCRLAIIDLSPLGHQPMSNEDGAVWLAFNGEIYNYRELIAPLEQAGHRFRSRSDSEVIIHAYEEWGPDCLSRLNGMFAFAIWDRRTRSVFIARDRLGVKPLYYWSDGAHFAFASEVKSLLAFHAVPRALNEHALHSYLMYEYVPAPESIFSGIKKLPAGNFLQLRLDGSDAGRHTISWTPTRYWDLQFRDDRDDRRTEEDCAVELRALLKSAVERRLMSDVPLGAFLSGGLDSSSIVALMAEIMNDRPKTFSIGFAEQTFNELPYAEAVARHCNTEHHVEILQADATDLIDLVSTYLDEPFADASALPTYLVSKSARQFVTVILSGDGGDELFAGYDWYRAQNAAAHSVDLLPDRARRGLRGLASHIPPTAQKKGALNVARRFLEGATQSSAMQHVRWQRFWNDAEMRKLLVGAPANFTYDSDPQIAALFAASNSPHALDQQQYADIKRYLADDILFKVDRMSMAVSLEARGPFLDYTLAEFAAGLPLRLREQGIGTKYLLKRAMASSLPEVTLHRKKLGFNIPYKNWLRRELQPLLLEALAPDRLRRQGLFQPIYVQGLVREHLTGTRDHAHKLWSLLMFQLWAERFLYSAPRSPEGRARLSIAR